jgi:segregation and condensation protein B
MVLEDDVKIAEAILFVRGGVVTPRDIQRVLNLPESECRRLLDRVEEMYRERDGAIEVVKAGVGYVMQVKAEYSDLLSSFAPMELPKPVLKTLATIAYHQPISQSELVRIRGNVVYSHVRELEKMGFVRGEKSGRTKILTTTTKFSEYFGIEEEDIKDTLRKMMGRPAIGCTPSVESFLKLVGIDDYVVCESPEDCEVFVAHSSFGSHFEDEGNVVMISCETFDSLLNSLENLSVYGSKRKFREVRKEIERLKRAMLKRAERIGIRVKPMSPMVRAIVKELGFEISDRGVKIAPDDMKVKADIKIPANQNTLQDIVERYEVLLNSLENLGR